jgi:imidazolonepropionase-like amidohydrolase
MTPLEAVTAATSTNALALGLEGEIGQITPGRIADLLVVDGDPAADVTAIGRTWAVIQGGRRVR